MKNLLYTLLAVLALVSCAKEEEVVTPPAPKQYTLAISAETGGTVSTEGGLYNEGSKITVTATPDGMYLFKEWSDGSTQNPREITVTSNLTLKASFIKKKYRLSVTVEGEGRVQEEVIIQGSTSETTYNAGTTVRLTATPNEGWVFAGWSGDVESEELVIEVPIEKGTSVNALFKRDFFELNITIEGEGTVKEEVIIQPGQYDYETVVRLTAIPADGWIFYGWNGYNESQESTIQLNIKESYFLIAEFRKIEDINMVIPNTLEIFKEYSRVIEVSVQNELIIRPFDEVNNDWFESERNTIKPKKSGTTSISINYNGFEKDFTLEVLPFQKRDVKSNREIESIIKTPIILINHIPSIDGINLDLSKIGYNNASHNTVEDVKETLRSKYNYLEYSIEEGSKFRGYKNYDNIAYTDITPVEIYDFYELPLKPASFGSINEPDYYQIFKMIGLESLVNESGVKEVWFWISPLFEGSPSYNPSIHSPDDYYVMPESNMASPSGLDISNSYRDPNDLPVYESTYVVYGNVYNVIYSNDIHIRGHQIEAQLRFLDQTFFDDLFVGNKNSGFRVGNVHFPPNGREDYDYANELYSQSDILDWKPNGGVTSSINRDLWYNQEYNWPTGLKDYQGNWLLFWFQSIPGYQNGILYERDDIEYSLTNWWDLFYNWDDALIQNKTLWE